GAQVVHNRRHWPWSGLSPLLARFHFEQQGLLGALSTRHTDERQSPIYNGGRHGPDRMPIGEAPSILCGDIHLTVIEAIFHPQLLPQTLRRRAGPTARRD